MSYSAQHLNSTNTKANKLARICAHETIDLTYERPLPRVASVMHVEMPALPRYPGAVARTWEGHVFTLPATLDERGTDGRRVVHVLTTH